MTSRIISISGRIKRGNREASANFRNLIAAAAFHFPAVADCGKYGMTSMQLDQDLDKGYADCWTPKVLWQPLVWNGKLSQGENRLTEFGFIEIEFEYPLGEELYKAWIVFLSGHAATYYNARVVDIIAGEPIGGSGVVYGTRCAVHIDHVPAKPRPASFGDNYVNPYDSRRLW